METYHGYVRTPSDAIKLFEACRLGLLPRVQRRLSEKERQSIRSGSVFVWDEREAGMRRWTDGKSWSASRVSGSFLTYREMEGKRGGGFGSGRRGAGKTPDSGRASDEDQEDNEPEGYRYKADGLMKQSFSITTSTGQHLHLISYYSRPQPGQPDLSQPSNDPALRSIVPVKGMYPESSMGEASQTPALTRAPMQQHSFMVAPQHGHPPPSAYGHQYPPSGYGWPPSPVATPPYSHYTAAYPPPGPPHPQHHGYQLPAQPSPYSHGPALPPPHQFQHQMHHISRMPSPPRLPEIHRENTLQAAAQAAMGDPRVVSSARNPQGPLPSLNASTKEHAGPTLAAIATPPNRAMSLSPPRSSHSDAGSMSGHRSNLSALLHPMDKDVSKPCGVSVLEKSAVSEDARALRMLDRKFCI